MEARTSPFTRGWRGWSGTLEGVKDVCETAALGVEGDPASSAIRLWGAVVSGETRFPTGPADQGWRRRELAGGSFPLSCVITVPLPPQTVAAAPSLLPAFLQRPYSSHI